MCYVLPASGNSSNWDFHIRCLGRNGACAAFTSPGGGKGTGSARTLLMQPGIWGSFTHKDGVRWLFPLPREKWAGWDHCFSFAYADFCKGCRSWGAKERVSIYIGVFGGRWLYMYIHYIHLYKYICENRHRQTHIYLFVCESISIP